MTSLLRASLAARRWAVGVLLVLTTVLGALVVHAMSGSSPAHAGPAAVVHAVATADAVGDAPGDGPCHECSLHEHGAAETACAVALVIILTLSAPALGRRWVLPPLRATLAPAGAGRERFELGRRPSLVALGISRT